MKTTSDTVQVGLFDLKGAALAWAVAKARGWVLQKDSFIDPNDPGKVKCNPWWHYRPDVNDAQAFELLVSSKMSAAGTGNPTPKDWFVYGLGECYGVNSNDLLYAICLHFVTHASKGGPVEIPANLIEVS